MTGTGKLPLSLQLVLLTAAAAFTKLALDVINFTRSAIASWPELSSFIADGTLNLWGSFSRPILAFVFALFAVYAFWQVLLAPRRKAYAVAFWFLVVAVAYFAWRLFVWYNGGQGPWRLEANGTRMVVTFAVTRCFYFVWITALLVAVWPNYVLQRTPGT